MLCRLCRPIEARIGRAARGLLAVLVVLLAASETARGLVITEIMYHSDRRLGDDTEDKRYEFIEFYNENRDPLDLSGYWTSNGVSYEFPPNTFIDGMRYIVVCADPATIRSEYGLSRSVVFGPWSESTSLDNSGERIVLSKPGGVEVIRVTYNDRGKWPSGADGTGHSLVLEDPYIEVDDPDHWRLSRDLGGSPGKRDSQPSDFTVIINEALIDTNGERFVEFYNYGGDPVDLTGYHVTTNRLDLTLATLPIGSTVAPKSWLSYTDSELGLQFVPPLEDDRVFIALSEPGGARVRDAYIFRPSVAERSEARFPDGDEDVEDAAIPTPSAANRVDVNSDVVINEVMYHSIADDPQDEYVELYNKGSQAVDMTGWYFNKGINFAMPNGLSIGPGRYLVIARNPVRIRALHGLSASEVIGPATPEAIDDFGQLADQGERITLKDDLGNIVDTLRYYDGGEWPHWADGKGSSLELVDVRQDNSLAQAWDASDESQKSETTVFSYTGRFVGGESELQFALLGRGITIIDDISLSPDGGAVVADKVFIEVGDSWKYFKGTREASSPVTAWRQRGFNDASWPSGRTGIGYGDDDDATQINDMRNNYVTIFCRKKFIVTNRNAIEKLFLTITVDDGFFAYLNGTLIAQDNVAGSAFDSNASGAGEPHAVTVDIISGTR